MNITMPFNYSAITRPAWHIDKPLLVVVLALLSIGLVMVASASFSYAEHNYNNEFFFVKRHLIYLVIAGGAMVFTFLMAPTLWSEYSRLWMLLAILLLIVVLVPGIGREVNGSRRWLSLGGMTLQVSEFAKVATVVFLASYFDKRHENFGDDWRDWAKPLGVLLVPLLLLLMEPDFGSTVVLAATFMVMLFLTGTKLWHYCILVLVGLAVMYIFAEAAPYRVARLSTFMDPWSDRFASGYQLTQSLIAFGRGEWFGVGLGQSVQKMLYLPEAHTDFVFAIFAEEFGFVGVICLLGLYSMLVLRIFHIGKKAVAQEYWFGAFLLIGFGLLISGQTFINLGVNAGLLPTKGLTLPFVSYGGSSLLVTCAMVGMMLRISHELHADTQVIRRVSRGH
jgi:cell division protein FtsW